MNIVTDHIAAQGGLGITLLRWSARLSAAGLFYFWGLFFVEHSLEFDPHNLPPLRVFVFHGLHFLLLLSLLIGWRWELAGGLLVIASAVAFFVPIAGTRGLLFAAITMIPGILWLLCAWRSVPAVGKPALP